MEDDFITAEEAAKIAHTTESALAQLRYRGGSNPLRFYRPTPRRILYKRSEVLAWIEASAHTRTDQPAALAG